MQHNAVLEEEAQQDLPNKCKYPIFAGFQGEKYLTDILRLILPRALFNTWQILVEEQAYGNEIFLSQSKLAAKAGRALRTIRNHLAELRGKGLMMEMITQKTFFNQDGTFRVKTVVVKHFEGLYDLAYEYHLWTINPAHIEPDPELVEAIRQNEHLVAKLRRFDNYRKLLYNEMPGPEAQGKEYPWFSMYHAEDAKDAELYIQRQVYLQKQPPKQRSKAAKERINETDQNNSRDRDSFESAETFEKGRAGSAGYKKNETKNEQETKTSPSSPLNTVQPGAGKTSGREENDPEVQEARRAMVVAGVEPERKRLTRNRQAEEQLPPPKNPLACSFIDVISTPFGDTNRKGTKTGIERSIETFGLKQHDIVLCLVRAMQVAKTSKIRRENVNQAGVANRMKLYCHMFKEFARARASGSRWDYSWNQMLDDLEADDLFAEWIVAHQAELAGNDQRDIPSGAPPSEADPSASPEAEEHVEGWERRNEACGCAEYLADQLASVGYGGITIKVRLPKGGTHYQILVFPDRGLGYRLVSEEDVMAVVELAQQGLLFTDLAEEQAAAGD